MNTILANRSGGSCELCQATTALSAYLVAPKEGLDASDYVYACEDCQTQLDNPQAVVPARWRCLNDSMWSEVPAVQVLAYRTLHQLRHEGWPAALLEMLYLEDETKKWALAGLRDENATQHLDANGAILNDGDSVTLIKDLKVKGANFTAKRGTKVKNIRLVAADTGQIEGKVEGQGIVILTQFVKKA